MLANVSIPLLRDKVSRYFIVKVGVIWALARNEMTKI